MATREEVTELLKYPPETAGGLMGKEFAAVEQNLCTESEVKKCRHEQKARMATDPATLSHVMVKYGIITKNQAKRLKETIKESKAAAGQIPGYKVLGKLGSGAMAVVYKAKQLSLDRMVAIKVMIAPICRVLVAHLDL